MFCENCKINPASGYIEETKAGLVRRINLCSRCLSQKEKMTFGVNMFSQFLSAPQIKQVCLVCNTTLNTILNTLFVGCPDCYTELGEQLAPVIKNIQGTISHAGTRPGESISIRDELKQLKLQLNQAIKEERFEDAALLNKRIKSIEEKK